MPPSDREGVRADRGFVTAEAAMVIPTVVLLGLALLWGLAAAATQLQCVDAARAGARAAARSEPRGTVLAVARAAAPEGAAVALAREADLWRVRVEAQAPGPTAVPLRLRAQAVALAEDTWSEFAP
ncbi:TadE family type IV pilus minor pilin [Streptomyces sp. NPDC006879]|uniref:TadE family type IV pilus minor pilin n=1 Tax=Streptomyces sp. NPDC006879 TaxID=3364767 RepID=UPI0036A66D94